MPDQPPTRVKSGTDDDAATDGSPTPTDAVVGDELTILVPVRILEGEQVPAALVDVITAAPVVVLGYHVIPDQTAPEQASDSFGEQARTELEDLADAFRETGGPADTRLVFTHDPTQTFERVAADEAADAILLLNPAPSVDRILVAIGETINVDRLTTLTATLATHADLAVGLFHVAASEDARADGEVLLDRATDSLVSRGVPADRIDREVVVSDAPIRAIVEEAADDTDLVVLGESRPSLREVVFGDPSERVADHTLAPTLVVRRLPTIDAADASPSDDDPTGEDAETNG